MTINPDRVEDILLDCLCQEDEITQGEIPADAVIAQGVVQSYGFNPRRLASHRTEIKEMLSQLPPAFHQSTGGGWSFLEGCLDAEGNQWTDLHLRVEQLFCLGMGLGLVQIVTPREMWPLLRGGVPYFMVLDDPSDVSAEGMETDSER